MCGYKSTQRFTWRLSNLVLVVDMNSTFPYSKRLSKPLCGVCCGVCCGATLPESAMRLGCHPRVVRGVGSLAVGTVDLTLAGVLSTEVA